MEKENASKCAGQFSFFNNSINLIFVVASRKCAKEFITIEWMDEWTETLQYSVLFN
jgi:hypothetical protein